MTEVIDTELPTGDVVEADVGGSRASSASLLGRVWQSGHVLPVGLILVVVLVANGSYLTGLTEPNPLFWVSGFSNGVLAPYVAGGFTIDPNVGFINQALGHRVAVDLLHGRFPWWNPYEGLGAPLAGEMQAAALFPLSVLLILPLGLVPFHLSLEVIAGLGAYLLARRLGISALIAGVGGALFAVNGAFAWLSNSTIDAICFLPWILLGIERAGAFAKAKRAGGWSVLAVAVALCFLSGFAEGTYLNLLFALGWAACRLAVTYRSVWVAMVRKGLVGFGCGVAMAAPLLVAFVDYLKVADTGHHDTGVLSTVTVTTSALPALVFPYSFGSIMSYQATDAIFSNRFWGNVGGYLTASVVLLAVLGALPKPRRPLRLVLAGYVAAGVLAIYSIAGPRTVVDLIPGMDRVAIYRYIVPSIDLCLVLLACLGLEALSKQQLGRRQLWVSVGVCWAVGLVLGCMALPTIRAIAHTVPIGVVSIEHHRVAFLVASMLPLLGCGVAVLALKGRARIVACCAIAVAEATISFAVPTLSAPHGGSLDLSQVHYLQAHLGQDRFFTFEGIQPNYGSLYGIKELNVEDNPVPKRFATFAVAALDPNVNPLLVNGLSSLTATGPTPLEAFMANLKNYEAVSVRYVLVPNNLTMPAAFFAAGGRTVFTSLDGTIDQLPTTTPFFHTLGPCTTKALSDTSVEVHCTKASTLVRNELDMAGWTSTVNGAGVPITAAAPVFQGVAVPAGTSVVTFSFEPPHARLAVAAAIVGLLVVCGFPLLVVLRRRRAGSAAG